MGPPLPLGKVGVQFLHVLEDANAGQGGDDFKDFPYLRLEIDKGSLPARVRSALRAVAKTRSPAELTKSSLARSKTSSVAGPERRAGAIAARAATP